MKAKLGLAVLAWTCLCAWRIPIALADFGDEGGRFHFDLGLSFVDGIYNADNALKSEVNQSNYSYYYGYGYYSQDQTSYSSVVIPVGLQLDPYYLFDFGLGIGGAVGPDQVLSISNGLGTTDLSAVIPVGLDLRYDLLNDSGFVPYGRLGIRYPIAFGDNYSDGQVGAFGALGIEFPRIHLGLEVSYDTSTIKVSYDGYSKTVTPSGFMATPYLHL